MIYSNADQSAKKKCRLSNNDIDSNISYESVIKNHVFCNDGKDNRIASRLAHSAYFDKINYNTAYPIIQRFVNKSIENSMSPRKSRSKIKTKREKAIEKNFIRDLKL